MGDTPRHCAGVCSRDYYSRILNLCLIVMFVEHVWVILPDAVLVFVAEIITVEY
jgi:hypothetical protein